MTLEHRMKSLVNEMTKRLKAEQDVTGKWNVVEGKVLRGVGFDTKTDAEGFIEYLNEQLAKERMSKRGKSEKFVDTGNNLFSA